MEYDLFPAPRPERSPVSPAVLPGADPQTTATLVNILKDNHDRWHCYFDREKKCHNHASLHLLALWALGANDIALEHAYAQDSSHQLPAIKSPEKITRSNWTEHLGDDIYFQAYFDFFAQMVEERGAIAAVEEYIFSLHSNFSDHDGEHPEHPAMLSRCLGLIFHALILIGYGIEFNIPGIVAEGLAQAAVHEDESKTLLTPTFFQRCLRDITRNTPVRFPIDVNTEEVGSVVSHMLVEGLLEKLNLSASTKPQETRVHALSVLARVSKDPRFDGFRQTDLYKVYEDVMNDFSGPISEYVAQWSLDMHFGATEENQLVGMGRQAADPRP
ncbi:hypothetical protein AX14_013430 [Amanita brunnescens Koide BX004]|nr:hypothetical protein AX14_013430 [Amanita brunnescens Koide BX004]